MERTHAEKSTTGRLRRHLASLFNVREGRASFEEIRRRYEENIRRYEAYATGDDPERVRRLLELDNEFHRIAFSAMGRENNFFHMLNDMQHIERLRAISLIDKPQTELNRDHSAISRAVLAGDEKEALMHLDRHLSLYQDSLLA